jgi:hypothetical protein
MQNYFVLPAQQLLSSAGPQLLKLVAYSAYFFAAGSGLFVAGFLTAELFDIGLTLVGLPAWPALYLRLASIAAMGLCLWTTFGFGFGTLFFWLLFFNWTLCSAAPRAYMRLLSATRFGRLTTVRRHDHNVSLVIRIQSPSEATPIFRLLQRLKVTATVLTSVPLLRYMYTSGGHEIALDDGPLGSGSVWHGDETEKEANEKAQLLGSATSIGLTYESVRGEVAIDRYPVLPSLSDRFPQGAFLIDEIMTRFYRYSILQRVQPSSIIRIQTDGIDAYRVLAQTLPVLLSRGLQFVPLGNVWKSK